MFCNKRTIKVCVSCSNGVLGDLRAQRDTMCAFDLQSSGTTYTSRLRAQKQIELFFTPALNQFTELDVISDYQLLESATRCVESSARDKLKNKTQLTEEGKLQPLPHFLVSF